MHVRVFWTYAATTSVTVIKGSAMAFSVFCPTGRLSVSDIQLQCMQRPHDGPQYNIQHKLTAGLRRCFEEIDHARLHGFDIKQRRRRNLSDLRFMFDQESEESILYARYKPISALGKGTFSQLIVAEDLYDPSHRSVAIKIMNRHCDYIGLQECQKIKLLNCLDKNDDAHIVKLLGQFYCGNHFCIVLELLGSSLLQHMKKYPHKRIPLEYIRKISIQLLASFAFLKNCGVIHADLKPENVLIENPTDSTSGCRIKVVDFGNAMTLADTNAYYDEFQVQSLYYRAPEILLGFWGFGYEIDMWSLGCLLVELFLGIPLFRVRSPEELVVSMLSLLGPFPANTFEESKFYSRYIKNRDHEARTAEELAALPLTRLNQLHKLLKCNNKHFVSFISGLLEYNPTKRLSPCEAIFHPFFTCLFPFRLVFRSLEALDSDDKAISMTSFSEDSEDEPDQVASGSRKRPNSTVLVHPTSKRHAVLVESNKDEDT